MKTIKYTAQEFKSTAKRKGDTYTLKASGYNIEIEVPAGEPYASYRLKGKKDGSITVRGEGEGSARRYGSGDGHAIRLGSGDGLAWRIGSGYGDAFRGGSGDGSAIRGGKGEGLACRYGSGVGDASRDGEGEGQAIRYGSGDGHAYEYGKLGMGKEQGKCSGCELRDRVIESDLQFESFAERADDALRRIYAALGYFPREEDYGDMAGFADDAIQIIKQQ